MNTCKILTPLCCSFGSCHCIGEWCIKFWGKRCSTWNVSFISMDKVMWIWYKHDVLLLCWKHFFLWMFKVFSLLSIQQIDNIFQLPNTILIIEMASTVFKTDRKILSNVKIEIFLPALNYACVTWSTEEKKIHHQWSAIDIKM